MPDERKHRMTTKRTLRVFLSSPGDVAAERALAEIVLRRLAREFFDFATLEVILWEHEPLFAHTGFQQQIQRASECDLVVSILWSRLGTRLPLDFAPTPGQPPPTGTEFELNDALQGFQNSGRPKLLIYRKVPAPQIVLGSRDFPDRVRQYQMLAEFCAKAFKDEQGAFIKAYHSFADAHDFERRLAEHVRRWLDREVQAPDGLEAKPRWRGRSPFRGLETFEAEHQEIFFGRSEAVGELVRRIRSTEEMTAVEGKCRLLLIRGMSGTGKTSLIKAGLLPLLAHRPIEGVGKWFSVSLRPSESAPSNAEGGPLGTLASLLTDQFPPIARLGTTAVKLGAALQPRVHEGVARIEAGLSAHAEQCGLECSGHEKT